MKYEQILLDGRINECLNLSGKASYPETRMTEGRKDKIRKALKGRKLSEFHKNKISCTLKGIEHSSERRKRQSARMKGTFPPSLEKSKGNRGKSVICVQTGIIYRTATNASKKVGIADNGVTKAILNNTKAAGYNWRYI